MRVEIFTDRTADVPAWVGDFAFLPRPDEGISVDRGGSFDYWIVRDVWHRGPANGPFVPCLLVERDD